MGECQHRDKIIKFFFKLVFKKFTGFTVDNYFVT